MEVKTKYNIGDSVYILDGYKMAHAVIRAVYFERHGCAPDSIIYGFSVFPKRKEAECFETKEELIKFLSE